MLVLKYLKQRKRKLFANWLEDQFKKKTFLLYHWKRKKKKKKKKKLSEE